MSFDISGFNSSARLIRSATIIGALLSVSCGRPENADLAQVSISLPAISRSQSPLRIALTNGVPDSLTEFDCLAINVMGEGIPNAKNPTAPMTDLLRNYVDGASMCSYPGVMIGPFPLDGSERRADLFIPTGQKRIFQILGVKQDGSARPCDAAAIHAGTGFSESSFYKIDDAVIPVYGDTTVDLRNRYDSLSAAERSGREVSCDPPPASGVTPDLVEQGLVIQVRGQDVQLSSGAILTWPFKYKPMNDWQNSAMNPYNTNPIMGGLSTTNGVQTVQFDGARGYEFNFAANPSLGSLSGYTIITVANNQGGPVGTLMPIMSLSTPNTGSVIEYTDGRSVEVGFKQTTNCTTDIRFVSQFTLKYGVRSYEWTPSLGESSQYGCVANPSGWQVHTIVKNVATGRGDAYQNGKDAGHTYTQHATVNAAFPFPNLSDGKFRLGFHKPSSTAEFFTGGFGELLVYNRVLSSAERRSVEKFLCIKYGISCPDL